MKDAFYTKGWKIIAIPSEDLQGVYNFCSPNSVNNREFSKILGKILHRNSWLNISVWALKMLYGNGAIVLVSGQEAIPERLLVEKFEFRFPELPRALTVS